MASCSSNNEGGGYQKEPPFAAHSSDKYAGPTSPPPPPTTSYPTQPPPGSAYRPPHAMYYPPAMGYPPGPGGQHHHHAYPQGYAAYTNEYPVGFHYPSAPYYGAPPTYRKGGGGGGGGSFLRSIILCSCILLMSVFIASLIVALVLRPQLPVYKVVSMSVANFSTTPAFAGDWDTKVTIENPNEKLRAYLSDFKVDVVYKDGVVAVNYAPGFELNENDVREMDAKGSSNHANEVMLEKTTMDDMGKERASGSVTFGLRVSSITMFKSGSLSTRSAEVAAICEGLKVVFQNNNGTGTLDNGGKPIECLVYV